MIIDYDTKLTYDDVLLRPQKSSLVSRSDADISTSCCSYKLRVPIISSNMDTITGFKMATKMSQIGGLGLIHRYMSVEEQCDLLREWFARSDCYGPIAVSVGTIKNDKERIDNTVKSLIYYRNRQSIICVDIAHGHSDHMIDTIKYIRDLGYTYGLMAGAVCTPEGTGELLESGADMVRVGIGNGGVCATRVKTGCGYPQLSAVLECAKIGPVVADGGISKPADAVKAIAAGAKAVMIGSMLAGTDCTPFWLPHSKHLTFRGMASASAREAFGKPGVNSEGIDVEVQAKPEGSTEAVITELIEGLRSAMSYCDSRDIAEFQNKAAFVRVSPSVVRENFPHILEKLRGNNG